MFQKHSRSLECDQYECSAQELKEHPQNSAYIVDRSHAKSIAAHPVCDLNGRFYTRKIARTIATLKEQS